MKNRIIILLLITLIVLAGCKKIINVPTPQNLLTADKVFSDTTSAKAAMVNCYTLFEKSIDPSYNINMGLYVDELDNPSGSGDLEFYQSKVSAQNGFNQVIWSYNYSAIYQCNSIIEQLGQSGQIPQSMISTLTGEAKFLRAYSYFYLLNTYGHIPLILTTDVNKNASAFQSDSTMVMRQIIEDLRAAQSLLPNNYIGSGKVRANKWAATALLARVLLYQRNWSEANDAATSVINSGYYSLAPLVNVFLANSSEAILQFWTQYGYITNATSLIPTSGTPQYSVSSSLLNAFEPGDLRKSTWLKSATVSTGTSSVTLYYPYKYHNTSTNTSTPEYLMGLRLAEQYLIRAEAKAQLNSNSADALADLNKIRQRAGLLPLSQPLDQSALLNAINNEWRVEFFAEWAHRYFNLKRTGRLNATMSNYRSTWQPTAVLLPIPQNEITKDINLKQNAGY